MYACLFLQIGLVNIDAMMLVCFYWETMILNLNISPFYMCVAYLFAYTLCMAPIVHKCTCDDACLFLLGTLCTSVRCTSECVMEHRA